MIGLGVYDLSEVARYTGLPPATVRSWFKASKQNGKPIFRSDHDIVDGDFAVSFLNLMEVWAAKAFREKGVHPTIIRRAHEVLQKELSTPHPFAHADLRTENGRILLRGLDQQEDATLRDVITKQHLFASMYSHLKSVTYNKASRLAESWGIARGIRINPGVAYGKPVIESTGVSTVVIANQFHANRHNADLVASLYRISPADVANAVAFEEGLKKRRAA